MDKYSFQKNGRLKANNANGKLVGVGRANRPKSSRYDAVSETSGQKMSDHGDKPIYFGDVASRKKLITDLSQKGMSQGRSAKANELSGGKQS